MSARVPLPERFHGREGSGDVEPVPESHPEPEPEPEPGETRPARGSDETVPRVRVGKRACTRETPDPDPGSEGEPGRPTVGDWVIVTFDALARHLRSELSRAGRALATREIFTERPPAVRDRYARVTRLRQEHADLPGLVRRPWMGGERVAATTASLAQGAANCVGTLPGLLTTTGVVLAVLQLTLGVPF